MRSRAGSNPHATKPVVTRLRYRLLYLGSTRHLYLGICIFSPMEACLSETLHSAAPHHLPGFITAPGNTDVLMVAVGVILVGAILMVGNLYLKLHSLPERMAHRTHKLQFEIVAVLGLISLFTHNHLYWIIGLLLAMVDLPDFLSPLRRIAGGVEKLAGVTPPADEADAHGHPPAAPAPVETVPAPAPVAVKSEVQSHA